MSWAYFAQAQINMDEGIMTNATQVLRTLREVNEDSGREQTQRIDRLCSTITSQPFDKDHFELLVRSLERWVEEAASWNDIKGETSTVVSLQDAIGGLTEIRYITAAEKEEWASDAAVDAMVTADKEQR